MGCGWENQTKPTVRSLQETQKPHTYPVTWGQLSPWHFCRAGDSALDEAWEVGQRLGPISTAPQSFGCFGEDQRPCCGHLPPALDRNTQWLVGWGTGKIPCPGCAGSRTMNSAYRVRSTAMPRLAPPYGSLMLVTKGVVAVSSISGLDPLISSPSAIL